MVANFLIYSYKHVICVVFCVPVCFPSSCNSTRTILVFRCYWSFCMSLIYILLSITYRPTWQWYVTFKNNAIPSPWAYPWLQFSIGHRFPYTGRLALTQTALSSETNPVPHEPPGDRKHINNTAYTLTQSCQLSRFRRVTHAFQPNLTFWKSWQPC